NKPKGISSAGVVGRLKYLLHPRKIGHAGTLDPLATGVLPIALGKATRLIPFVMGDTKTYEFDVKWGIETDTDDLAGNEISNSDKHPKKQEILEILPQFQVKITQIPSPYCAIKIDGKRAYDLARQGKQVNIPERTINVFQLELLKNSKDKASFVAKVNKGTYIRTLAHDIAHALGTVGVVTKLHRIQDGPFCIEQAVSLESDLKILSLECVLGKLPKLEVPFKVSERVKHGQRIKDPILIQNLPLSQPIGIYCEQKIIAIAHIEKGVIHPDCLLV
ncbi:MAG: tRNA pseudouridine(55) synthase TruB, partial [Alphaproteobacteria bacterium]|nr:tRNA pseudouridine(55) synthase TruB [Alphaproteobacteria bacterium]